RPAAAGDSIWRNLFSTYQRVDADPLPYARVRVTIADTKHEVVADDEGFIRAWIELGAPLPANAPWQPATLELLAPLPFSGADVRTMTQVRVLSAAPTFGVISDLDDTV